MSCSGLICSKRSSMTAFGRRCGSICQERFCASRLQLAWRCWRTRSALLKCRCPNDESARHQKQLLNLMIRTENLTKSYGSLVAVNNLNLDIKQGEFFAFLGPNAAGKTTTIKLLAGLLKPTSGRALIGGYDIQTQPIEARKIVAYVPDLPFLYDKLEPMEFMLFIAQIYGIDRKRAQHDADA